jgi:hypothetical protein
MILEVRAEAAVLQERVRGWMRADREGVIIDPATKWTGCLPRSATTTCRFSTSC